MAKVNVDTIQNIKMIVSFDQQILSIKFVEEVTIGAIDLQKIYAYGNEKSNGLPYCILFNYSSNFDLTESALEYALNYTYDIPILAKAYVVTTKEKINRVRLHLSMDNPFIKPTIFESEEEAIEWLQSFLKEVPIIKQ